MAASTASSIMAASRGSTRELASAAKCMMSAPAIQPFSGGDGENSHVNGNWKLGASASSASLHSCYRDVFHHVRKLTVQIWCMYFRQNPNTKLPIPLARPPSPVSSMFSLAHIPSRVLFIAAVGVEVSVNNL